MDHTVLAENEVEFAESLTDQRSTTCGAGEGPEPLDFGSESEAASDAYLSDEDYENDTAGNKKTKKPRKRETMQREYALEALTACNMYQYIMNPICVLAGCRECWRSLGTSPEGESQVGGHRQEASGSEH